MSETPQDAHDNSDELSSDQKRTDQLTTAPKASESDADPRIDVTATADGKRIDIRDDAEVRPGSAG